MQSIEENKAINDGGSDRRNRLTIFLHALAFVLGFTTVFVIGWGGAASLLGGLFREYKDWIARIGGVVLIIFGLATMEIIRIPWFFMDTRPEFRGNTRTFAGSLVMGLFFAAGWSPCIGATLGAILTLGYSQDTMWQSMILSSGYSLGMGIPFLLMAIGLESAMPLVRQMRKYLHIFQTISGVLIITIGILLIFKWMTLLSNLAMDSPLFAWMIDFSNWLIAIAKNLNIMMEASELPGYLTAVAAGALSFLSPCVLPLVPAYLGYLSGHALGAVKQPSSAE